MSPATSAMITRDSAQAKIRTCGPADAGIRPAGPAGRKLAGGEGQEGCPEECQGNRRAAGTA